MLLFFSFFFFTDFCDQPNVAEFNDTPMTEYCDSVLNMKRFLKEINDTVFNDVSDLKRQRLARFREVPHMRVLARHRTWRSALVSLVHAPRRVTARAWWGEARQRELRRWFCPRRQRRAVLGFKSSRINTFLWKSRETARALPQRNDASGWKRQAKRDFTSRFFVFSR